VSEAVVAVIDIGSNSIKLLVARRGTDGGLLEVFQRTEETRIGTGITGNPPRLGDEAMHRGIASVRSLLDDAARHAPGATALVATSAVRDASNREEFVSRLRDGTGHTLSVLKGEDEALLIGRGIACDPALGGAAAFYLFDLGGGSLEMLAFRDGQVVQSKSLQLGCVRVTELCVRDPARPLARDEARKVRAHVLGVVVRSRFRFDIPRPVTAVATGGTVTTFRAMRAAAEGVKLDESNPLVPVADVAELAAHIGDLAIEERRAIPGLPPERADVLPAALLTLVEIAQLAGVNEFRHSFYNLRFGLAAEMLGVGP
jgi:exopolyphosphatase/guanosine-5'-triphosphate,3'-diphosphate pyrophosphatase